MAALRSKSDPVVDALLKRIVLKAIDLGIDLTALEPSHFPGAAMPADPISRNRANEFIADLKADFGVFFTRIERIQVPVWTRRELTQVLLTS